MNRRNLLVHNALAVACALGGFLFCRAAAADSYAGKSVVVSLERPAQEIASRNPHIDYNIDPLHERFFVYVPAQYTGDEPYGLIVFVSHGSEWEGLPLGWKDVLEKRKLIFVCPLGAGNLAPASRRMGMAIYAALGAERHWKIDATRIYAAGFSGGAGIAGWLGFFAPDIFTGSIQICGADFYKPVPQVEGKPLPRDKTPYGIGLANATQAEIDAARKRFRFVVITGEKDYRRGQIRDIVIGGYVKDGFQCALIDVAGMYHDFCPPKRLNQAIDFIENVKTVPTTQPAPPGWIAKDPSQWPPILLRNEIIYKNNRVGHPGSSYLIRLPSGVVVLGTAGHLFGDAKPAEFASAFKSWMVFGMEPGSSGVQITRFAMDLANPRWMDALVFCPRSQSERWPSTVLPIRREPLEMGDVVYLITAPIDGEFRQDVHDGVVVYYVNDHEFRYDVDGFFNTMGCSGAAVMDEFGQLAGINVGHLNGPSIEGRMSLVGVDAAAALQVIKLPPDVKPAAAEAEANGPSPTAWSDNPSNLANKKADDALRSVQVYIDNKRYEKAKIELHKIVETYPASDAATKARQLLAQLPDGKG